MINCKQIVLYFLGLCMQNPWLRQVDLESTPKRGSDNINMLTQERKTTTENNSYSKALNHIQKPSTLRGKLRTRGKNWLYALQHIKTTLPRPPKNYQFNQCPWLGHKWGCHTQRWEQSSNLLGYQKVIP